MANKLAKSETTGRDLIAAVQLGPGPALEAAIDQLGHLDDERGHSRVSQSELQRLAQRLVENCPLTNRIEILGLLARHPSLTARGLSAHGLAYAWEEEGSLDLAKVLSRDRSPDVQAHLSQSLLALSPEHKRGLSQKWQHSPLANQRAISARLASSYPHPQALNLLSTMSSDEDMPVREASVEALVDLASDAPDMVLQTFQSWTDAPVKHKLWVITRVLSHAPLNRHIQPVITILENLSEAIAADKDVHRWTVGVLRALARQHRNLPVQEALSHWLKGNDDILADVANEALRRIA